MPFPPAYFPIKAFGLAAGGRGKFLILVLALEDLIASSLGSLPLAFILTTLLIAVALTLLLEPTSGAGASLLKGAISPWPVVVLPKFTSIYEVAGGITVAVGCCQCMIINKQDKPIHITKV